MFKHIVTYLNNWILWKNILLVSSLESSLYISSWIFIQALYLRVSLVILNGFLICCKTPKSIAECPSPCFCPPVPVPENSVNRAATTA